MSLRIIGIMVVGPNEKYLEKSLNEFKRLCDDTIIATNNIDEKTKQTIREFGFKRYEDNREWGKYQPDIKSTLLKRAGELSPDWIIAIDADECFAKEFTREEAIKLTKIGEIAYYFLVVNLYNDEKHFAHSSGIQRFWNIRFYKYMPEYGLQFQRKSLHCGLGPPITYKYGWHAPFYLLHYGLMDKEDRRRKAERYRKYDPNRIFKSGTYYDELEQDITRIYDFNGDKLLKQLSEAVDTQPRKIPKIHD